MGTQRSTPGKFQRQEWEQPWTERVPQELLILGKVYLEVVRMVLEDKGPSHDPTANWEELYQCRQGSNLNDLLRTLADPEQPPSQPSDDQELNLDDWVKKVGRYIIRLDRKAKSCSPQMQSQLIKHARGHLNDLRKEIRACLDIIAALVLFRTHPTILIVQARSGDKEALEKLLQINPSMESQPWVRNCLGELVRTLGLNGVGSVQQAVTYGLQIRKNKLLEIGCILTVLWPLVCRLTSDQRRGFLKALGLKAVPTKKALREFERRLNLKSAMERTPSLEEQKLFESMRLTTPVAVSS